MSFTKPVEIKAPVLLGLCPGLCGINQLDYPSNMRRADRQLQAHYVTSMVMSAGVKGASDGSQI